MYDAKQGAATDVWVPERSSLQPLRSHYHNELLRICSTFCHQQCRVPVVLVGVAVAYCWNDSRRRGIEDLSSPGGAPILKTPAKSSGCSPCWCGGDAFPGLRARWLF